MTRARSKPPAPGAYCNATTSRYRSQCNDPAVWLVFFVDKATGDPKHQNACGGHLNRLLADLTPLAEYSREMFRVLPWVLVMKQKREEDAAEAASA